MKNSPPRMKKMTFRRKSQKPSPDEQQRLQAERARKLLKIVRT